jgi:hypothetical protein
MLREREENALLSRATKRKRGSEKMLNEMRIAVEKKARRNPNPNSFSRKPLEPSFSEKPPASVSRKPLRPFIVDRFP